MSDSDRTQRLQRFADWARQYVKGDEKSEAHIFLERLFQAFGHEGLLEAGGAAEYRIRKAKDDGGGTGFADCVWRPHVLIEMKKAGEDLAKHYSQAFRNWTRVVPGRPRYVVLCNFTDFWVYDFENQLDTPVDRVKRDELPERYGPLAFLFPTHEAPTFGNDHVKVTRDAAARLAACFNKLKVRQDVGRETAQRFILQMLVALFAEDIGLMEQYTIERLIDECKKPSDGYDLIGGLFVEMNTPGKTPGGRFRGVDYFNGGIFAHPARVELHPDELNLLRRAAGDDWSMVRPEIFGTLFEQTCDQDERHAYGAHFTSAVDIMKIVRPTITEPWEAAIGRADTIKELRALHQRMQDYCVLDPACGSGNFLYLAYRELKRLEKTLLDRMRTVSKQRPEAQAAFSFVTTVQFFGIDINAFAVELAKVTMMLAHKLAIDELHIDEPALPLDNLDRNIIAADALITFPKEGEAGPLIDAKPYRTRWPRADVIIGNPPFLGAKRLKPERGANYVNAVRALYPEVPGMADYCVYWFRRAHDELPVCSADNPLAGRAGLVGTQNVRNNKSREGGLDYVVQSGTIVDAVDNQPWSGEANVHVSIANWVKHDPAASDPAAHHPDAPALVTLDDLLIPRERRLWFRVDSSKPLLDPSPESRGRMATAVAGKRRGTRKDKSYELNVRKCDLINSALSDETSVSHARVLSVNQGYCYTGQYPRHSGFWLTAAQATQMIRANEINQSVVWPCMIGADLLTSGKPSRWVIDFQQRTLIDAKQFCAPFAHVERETLPYIKSKARIEHERTGRPTGQDQRWLETWWQHFRPRLELVSRLSGLPRFIVCARVTKRPVFAFLSTSIRPDNQLSCFVLADDFSFGILQSGAHWEWFTAKCSKLTARFRYTPESVFDTFSWPQGPAFDGPSVNQIEAVATAGREVRRIRAEALTKVKMFSVLSSSICVVWMAREGSPFKSCGGVDSHCLGSLDVREEADDPGAVAHLVASV